MISGHEKSRRGCGRLATKKAVGVESQLASFNFGSYAPFDFSSIEKLPTRQFCRGRCCGRRFPRDLRPRLRIAGAGHALAARDSAMTRLIAAGWALRKKTGLRRAILAAAVIARWAGSTRQCAE